MVETRAIVNATKELTTIVASKADNMRVINFDGISLKGQKALLHD
jgi:hypothetical protein